MKFVVPLTIPITRCTLETTSDSRSTFTTGIAAQTDASNRSCTPAADAVANSSAPRRATSCLFAVTTDLPARRSSQHVLAGRVEPAHHLRDDVHLRVVAHRGEVGREHAVRRAEAALLRGVADERAHDAKAVPGRPLDLVAALDEQPVDRRPDGAVAQEGDPDVN